MICAMSPSSPFRPCGWVSCVHLAPQPSHKDCTVPGVLGLGVHKNTMASGVVEVIGRDADRTINRHG